NPPTPAPGRGQPPPWPAQTPLLCSTSPESLLAPPPSLAQFASAPRPRRRHVQLQFCPCSLRTRQTNRLNPLPGSRATLIHPAPAFDFEQQRREDAKNELGNGKPSFVFRLRAF